MIKIECFSHGDFDSEMLRLGLNNSNAEELNGNAFISIIGTKECLEYWLDEASTRHYFDDDCSNVLNLEFDDLSRDLVYHGHLFKAMTMEQAERSVDFIEDMLNKGVTTFKVHCRQGKSRSRAYCEFIARIADEVEYNEREEWSTRLNQGVLRCLMHAYKKKHKLDEYAEENVDYPSEMTDVIKDYVDDL